jgi:hypothetical protein
MKLKTNKPKLLVKILIVRLRMFYAKLMGRKRWNYDASKHYMKKKV